MFVDAGAKTWSYFTIAKFITPAVTCALYSAAGDISGLLLIPYTIYLFTRFLGMMFPKQLLEMLHCGSRRNLRGIR